MTSNLTARCWGVRQECKRIKRTFCKFFYEQCALNILLISRGRGETPSIYTLTSLIRSIGYKYLTSEFSVEMHSIFFTYLEVSDLLILLYEGQKSTWLVTQSMNKHHYYERVQQSKLGWKTFFVFNKSSTCVQTWPYIIVIRIEIKINKWTGKRCFSHVFLTDIFHKQNGTIGCFWILNCPRTYTNLQLVYSKIYHSGGWADWSFIHFFHQLILVNSFLSIE